MMASAKYRKCFASDMTDIETFLMTDHGGETFFIFEHGIELPHFALFTQLSTPEGRDRDVLL